ncbi:orotate phosphoribosyltransferase, putative [Plasmodium gallinaceum]|uniref:orotate phosphoribosyltransferase n=1 Tax=Plasmodium gallinaceum TaxID=5849 RepID=A0A1J1H027_PLAGA|nr:orotate phosphoribosyltransferase, putative [Plasmodium gallinaceum]CRG97905.1 orotate phosphoribosyltransferase, putative [Plasmodium gallinaceum]
MRNGNTVNILSDEEINKKYVELKNKINLENDEDDCHIKEMKHLLKIVCLKYKAIKFGDFILKSKRKSKYFFSSGVLNNVISANIISFLISHLILKKNFKFDYLLGASYKGIPIATLTSYFLFSSNKYHNVFYLYDRKEKKEYGDKNDIIGILEDNNINEEKKIIIIDDVFTCGTALGEILNKLKHYNNLKVIAIIVLFNRNEYNINENNEKIYFKDLFEQKFNIPLYSILNYNEDFDHLI